MSQEKGAIMERLKIQGTTHPTSPFITMEMRGRLWEGGREGESERGEKGE